MSKTKGDSSNWGEGLHTPKYPINGHLRRGRRLQDRFWHLGLHTNTNLLYIPLADAHTRRQTSPCAHTNHSKSRERVPRGVCIFAEQLHTTHTLPRQLSEAYISVPRVFFPTSSFGFVVYITWRALLEAIPSDRTHFWEGRGFLLTLVSLTPRHFTWWKKKHVSLRFGTAPLSKKIWFSLFCDLPFMTLCIFSFLIVMNRGI